MNQPSPVKDLPLSDDFLSIVLQEIPLIDVRAPVEFYQGSFPGAVNLPLLDDEERRLVGIRYKEEGNERAVELGHTLVSGEAKERRVDAWLDFIKRNPNAMLYCFRGGQRSRISQQWIADAGKNIVRLKGGYKAFRNFLITTLDELDGKIDPVILGGRTGSGKTKFLKNYPEFLDLEEIANHRGSSFGRHIHPQPTQIHFEDTLGYKILQLISYGRRRILIEDEGKNVGRLYLPKKTFETFAKAPLLVLETDIDERTENIFQEYVIRAQKEYSTIFREDGLHYWSQSIEENIDRIERRLGGDRHREVKAMFQAGFESQEKSGSVEEHRQWIELLLREYYDPMYDYQLSRKEEKIIFRGTAAEIREYLENV